MTAISIKRSLTHKAKDEIKRRWKKWNNPKNWLFLSYVYAITAAGIELVRRINNEDSIVLIFFSLTALIVSLEIDKIMPSNFELDRIGIFLNVLLGTIFIFF